MTEDQQVDGLDDIVFGSPVKAGTYDARLKALVPFDAQYEGEERHLIKWVFQVAVDEGIEELEGVTSRATGPKSKMRGWVASLLGRQPDGGERLGGLGLVGKPCMVVIALDDGGYPKVDAVLPPKR